MSSRLLRSLVLRQTFMRTSPIIYRPATTAQPSWQQPVLNIAIRFYAKKIKDNKKRNESKTAAKEEIEEYVPQFNENELTKRFEASIAHLRDQLVTMRVGRANPALLDNVRVRIENSQFSLRDLAQITVRDPQTLLVTVHDNDYTSAVEKSIREAGLNLNPIVDNKMIKVPIPKPTKESRDKMAKLVSNMGEQFKLKVRAIRQDGMKHLKQDLKHQPADQIKKLEKTVQNMTDKYNKTIDDILKSKIKEIQS